MLHVSFAAAESLRYSLNLFAANLSVRQRRRRDRVFPWQRESRIGNASVASSANTALTSAHARSQSLGGGDGGAPSTPNVTTRHVTQDVRIRRSDEVQPAASDVRVAPAQSEPRYFDENAYLEGRVNIVSHCVNNPRPTCPKNSESTSALNRYNYNIAILQVHKT